jgi:drug/metabolite transporter (DMT)-like permease
MSIHRTQSLLGFFVLCSTAAQVLLKAAGLQMERGPGTFAAWLLNPYLWLVGACYAWALLAWIYVLKALPLSKAYPWSAVVYVLTPVAAMLIWGERLSATYLAGMACILCGILVITQQRRNDVY